jgi:hypothetical protein
LIDDPKQFDSSPKCNTIKIAKEHVPEANQLTFTSNSPATFVNNNIEIAAVRVSDAVQDIITNKSLPTIDTNIIEIAENICDQDPFLKNPFLKNHFRSRPPSFLKRPTQDWLNHLELVHQVMKPNHSLDGQFLFESQPDLSKNIAFLPLIGQRWF